MTRSEQIATIANCLQTLNAGKAQTIAPSHSDFRNAELLVNCLNTNGKVIANA